MGQMNALRIAATVSHAIGVVGGFGGVAAQWVLFRKGNFSEVAGDVFIPFLGQHGVYTSNSIGAAWYGSVGLFLLGLAGTALCWRLERREERPTDNP